MSNRATKAQLAERVIALQAENHALKRAGTPLATCAFNLAQDLHIHSRHRATLDECRRAWDAAVGNGHETIVFAGKPLSGSASNG